MHFNLIENNRGRVVLTHEVPGTNDKLIDVINAKDWVAARTKVNESDLYHLPGYGWFRR